MALFNFKNSKSNAPKYTKAQIELVKEVVDKSDNVVVDIFHFINKTLDKPSKQEILVYRKAILNLLNQKNDEKFQYIYDVASKSVYQQQAEEEKMKLELKNDVIMNPNIFSISWNEITKNIQEHFFSENDLNPESLKAVFIEEYKRLVELRSKINKMIELGVAVPDVKDLEVTEKTFLKLTDLVNIFMAENFQDVGAMIQEIEIFEKRYNLDVTAVGSSFIDANYKTLSNVAPPRFPGDAVNKAYVDATVEELKKSIANLQLK